MGADNKYLRTLELFSYDNYITYKNDKGTYIELKAGQVKKLKMISIADMAMKSKVLSYSDLMRDLDIKDLRELEDLIIDCIYNELLSGKLDQLHKQFHVVHTYGRDIRENDMDSMINKLEDWDKQLESAQVMIEKKMKECNSSIIHHYERQMKHEYEMRDRREQMLKDIQEDKEDMTGSGGMGGGERPKKKQGNDEGAGGFLQGFRPGFLR